jgi:hypothetical protein
MKLKPRWRKSLTLRHQKPKKSHAKTQSRKGRNKKKVSLNEGGQGTEVGPSVIGPKVSQSGSIWKLVSSFLCGFASWREIFFGLAS